MLPNFGARYLHHFFSQLSIQLPVRRGWRHVARIKQKGRIQQNGSVLWQQEGFSSMIALISCTRSISVVYMCKNYLPPHFLPSSRIKKEKKKALLEEREVAPNIRELDMAESVKKSIQMPARPRYVIQSLCAWVPHYSSCLVCLWSVWSHLTLSKLISCNTGRANAVVVLNWHCDVKKRIEKSCSSWAGSPLLTASCICDSYSRTLVQILL